MVVEDVMDIMGVLDIEDVMEAKGVVDVMDAIPTSETMCH